MITEGKYSVWFKTPIGDGAGMVEFGPKGELSGGDTTFSYIGNWEQDGERFKAAISAKRTAPGPPGVFGLDEIDIIRDGPLRWRSIRLMYWLCKAIAGSEA